MAGKHGLGRGLSSLIPQKNDEGEAAATAQRSNVAIGATVAKTKVARETRAQDDSHDVVARDGMHVADVAIGSVTVNSQQPRLYFNEEKLTELAASIKEHGILQPLTVTQKDDGYELIAGERRLRAAKEAGLSTVPVIVRDATSEQKKLELAIIENVQRHDLNIIEEAKSYTKLAEEFNLSQEEIAQKTGKSRSVVANRMRLMKLPIDIQRGLVDGKITEGHAKVILGLDNPEKQRALYDLIISGKLTVRDAERALTHTTKKASHVTGHARVAKTPSDRMLEDQLSTYFETKVSVAKKGSGGEIRIQYFSDEEIKGILAKLKL